ncbi:MAG: hypothetical protein GEU74_04425 [Nitriliruptorales bacterium]|nr:hypothetical protein [Nitriliruptorales bacterium]
MLPAGSAPSRWRASPARLVRLLAGLWLFGTGDALLVHAQLGNAPWTVLAQGVSLHTPLSIGVATQLIGVAVLLGWIPLRERPGLGTLCNVAVIGFAIDVMLPILPEPAVLSTRVVALLVGIALIGIGSGFYLTADLGPGPRDGWMTGLHRRYRWPLSRVRFGIEVSVLAAGAALGGTVGLGTAAFALLIGPAVASSVRVLTRRAAVPAPAGMPRA